MCFINMLLTVVTILLSDNLMCGRHFAGEHFMPCCDVAGEDFVEFFHVPGKDFNAFSPCFL